MFFIIFELSIIQIFFNNTIFTTSLNILKSTGTGTNLSTSLLPTLPFKLFKLVGTFFNLSTSNLSTSDFKLAKSTFLADFDLSSFAVIFEAAFVV